MADDADKAGAAAPLPADRLRRATDPASVPDRPRPVADGLIGQDRALDAIALATDIRKAGFNLYVMGREGSGRHSALKSMLARRAQTEPAPDDWVYVNNFAVPHRPRAIRLPGGTARAFREAMEELLNDLGAAIPALFESEEYKARRGAIDGEIEEFQEKAFAALNEKARDKGIAILRTPVGFAFTPQRDGHVVKPEVFERLPADERKRIEDDIAELQAELKAILERMPRLEKDRRDRIRALNKELATRIVSVEIGEVAAQFSEIPAIAAFLEEVSEDVIANVEIFIETAEAAQSAAMPVAAPLAKRDPRLKRYSVNVMVGDTREEGAGAPVVEETNPTYQNLVGRIEHVQQMGALVTDFTLIKPGALHRANGGYLAVDARQVLLQPGSWEALKRALKDREIRITTLAEQYSLVSTISLEPDPIPLSVKVALVGERLLYYLLYAYDPDFAELFKVEADFEDDITREEGAAAAYAGLIHGIAERDGLRPVARDGVARAIDEAARLAADSEKLTLRIGAVADILREADHLAGARGADAIGADDVAGSVAARRRRGGRLRERMHEAITRGTVLIDTEGEAVGQVNGLSVIMLGDQSFGTPSRITARARMGTGKVVDIEREVELGGPVHSKGVLILSGFLSARYALKAPASLWASLVFEQSYAGVEGDSASSAELYALLSALAEAPVSQSFAVTGSVNQLGEVQAIGAVNEKIEGFFDVCAARGLTGRQGVLIPAANVKHLMLRDDVVEACAAGRFAVHAVSTIDEGLALLTGIEAGERDGDGRFPPGSINARVEERLEAFAEARRRFGTEVKGEERG